MTSSVIEEGVSDWVHELHDRSIFLTGAFKQEKARQVQSTLNSDLPTEAQTHLNFNNGWLALFKKRNGFLSLSSHGESVNRDEEVIEREMPHTQHKLSRYNTCDIFNGDEYGLFYQTPLNIPTGPARLPGRKKRKHEQPFFVSQMQAAPNDCVI